jgi:hypothetical protein
MADRVRTFRNPSKGPNGAKRIWTNEIGKVLYPRLQPYQRRQQMKSLFASCAVGVVFAGVVATVMIMKNHLGR